MSDEPYRIRDDERLPPGADLFTVPAGGLPLLSVEEALKKGPPQTIPGKVAVLDTLAEAVNHEVHAALHEHVLPGAFAGDATPAAAEQAPPSEASLGSLVEREVMRFVIRMAEIGQEVRAITLAPAAYRLVEEHIREQHHYVPPATFQGLVAEMARPSVPGLTQIVIYTPAGPVTILRGAE